MQETFAILQKSRHKISHEFRNNPDFYCNLKYQPLNIYFYMTNSVSRILFLHIPCVSKQKFTLTLLHRNENKMTSSSKNMTTFCSAVSAAQNNNI